MFTRANTRRPREREREKAPYQLTHTESKQGAKTYGWRFASQYFTSTSLVNEIDKSIGLLIRTSRNSPRQPQISFCSSYREPPALELAQTKNQALFMFFLPLPAFLGKPGPSLQPIKATCQHIVTFPTLLFTGPRLTSYTPLSPKAAASKAQT